MKKTSWPGNWKVACHVCGMWFPSGEIKKRWDGLLVCHKDWETRHPQTLIKVREEKAVPAFVSKDPTDQFVFICDAWSSSPMADFGTADCATVGGNTNIEMLINNFNPSCVANIAITERSIPGVISYV